MHTVAGTGLGVAIFGDCNPRCRSTTLLDRMRPACCSSDDYRANITRRALKLWDTGGHRPSWINRQKGRVRSESHRKDRTIQTTASVTAAVRGAQSERGCTSRHGRKRSSCRALVDRGTARRNAYAGMGGKSTRIFRIENGTHYSRSIAGCRNTINEYQPNGVVSWTR
jgi:hypothetical protein